MENRYQSCPLCNCRVDYNPVYPHYICNACISKATNDQGEKVVFFHGHVHQEGLQGYTRKNSELLPFPGNSCYIRGVKCMVNFDHSHGIIFQPAYDKFREEDWKFFPACHHDEHLV